MFPFGFYNIRQQIMPNSIAIQLLYLLLNERYSKNSPEMLSMQKFETVKHSYILLNTEE